MSFVNEIIIHVCGNLLQIFGGPMTFKYYFTLIICSALFFSTASKAGVIVETIRLSGEYESSDYKIPCKNLDTNHLCKSSVVEVLTPADLSLSKQKITQEIKDSVTAADGIITDKIDLRHKETVSEINKIYLALMTDANFNKFVRSLVEEEVKKQLIQGNH